MGGGRNYGVGELNVLVGLSDSEVAKHVCDILKECKIKTIYSVDSTKEAVALMLDVQFNLFIIDSRFPVTLERNSILYGGIDFIRFIRICEGQVSEATIVLLRSATGVQNLVEASSEIDEAKEAGASVIMSRPFTLEKFKKDVVPLIENPRKFIRSAHYTGPCRRVQDRPFVFERRKTKKRLQPSKVVEYSRGSSC